MEFENPFQPSLEPSNIPVIPEFGIGPSGIENSMLAAIQTPKDEEGDMTDPWNAQRQTLQHLSQYAQQNALKDSGVQKIDAANISTDTRMPFTVPGLEQV
jgi:hypothetical protein